MVPPTYHLSAHNGGLLWTCLNMIKSTQNSIYLRTARILEFICRGDRKSRGPSSDHPVRRRGWRASSAEPAASEAAIYGVQSGRRVVKKPLVKQVSPYNPKGTNGHKTGIEQQQYGQIELDGETYGYI